MAPDENSLVQLAEHASDIIGLCDTSGELNYLNPAGRRLIGIEDGDVSHFRLTDYVVAEQRHLVDEVIVPTARAKGVWEGEMRLVNVRSNAVIDVQRSTFATRNDRGEVSGFVSVMRDVTAEKAAQAALARQVATFEGLIANNPFGVFLVDADFRLAVVSRGARTALDAVEPLIGRDFAAVLRDVWREPYASQAIERFRHTLASGQAFEIEAVADLRTGQADRVTYHWRIERVILPNERHGVVCYFYDLTERERCMQALTEREAQLRDLTAHLEQRVRERTAALNQANDRLAAEIERREAMQVTRLQSEKLEAVGQLTAGIAHDFNNILGAVVGGFSIIEQRSADPRITAVARMGQDAAGRGTALVRQLMAFARRESVAPQAVDLPGALQEIADLAAHRTRDRIALVIECNADVWPVHTDHAQLQSALLNLIGNACDVLDDSGLLRVVADNRPAIDDGHPPELGDRDAVVIEVADNGPGIDGRTLQRITEPFFTTKPPGRGTGLGLAMVQHFVQQSGGALRIESQVGAGTKFRIFLPRADEPPASAPHAGSDGDETAARCFETILLVDDDRDFLKILALGLADEGFDVIAVGDAADAMHTMRVRPIDALVTDIDMPDENGVQLMARMRAERPDVCGIFMTGGSGGAAPVGETVIHKPFAPAVLAYALRRALIERNRRTSDIDRMDRLARRLRSDCTRSLFEHWRAVRTAPAIPLTTAFSISQCSEPHRIVIADVDLTKVPLQFTFRLVGNTLSDDLSRVGNTCDLAVVGTDGLLEREAAYRRCALTGKPSYEYARINLQDGRVETFERLLLPFSSDGEVVDSIVGAIVIDQASAEELV